MGRNSSKYELSQPKDRPGIHYLLDKWLNLFGSITGPFYGLKIQLTVNDNMLYY